MKDLLPYRIAAILMLLVWAAAQTSCSSSTSDESASVEKEEQGAPLDDSAQEKLDRREAFGLPLPPEIRAIDRTATRVRVTTPMRMYDLEDFFKARLPEFEFVRSRHSIHGLPLYSYMPKIRIHRIGGPSGYRIVDYEPPQSWFDGTLRVEEIASASSPSPAGDMAQVALKGSEKLRTYQDRGGSRDRGQPVLLRTPEGELLAPGAQWGEPYVPPVGSPLHTERNRSNFGRPFGQWHAP